MRNLEAAALLYSGVLTTARQEFGDQHEVTIRAWVGAADLAQEPTLFLLTGEPPRSAAHRPSLPSRDIGVHTIAKSEVVLTRACGRRRDRHRGRFTPATRTTRAGTRTA
jgi:hypothetical protein